MQKIVLDALGIHQVGGGRTSIFTLFDHVFRLDPKTSYLVLLSAPEPKWDQYANVEQRIVHGGRFSVRLYLQYHLPRWVRRESVGLVHFTKNLGVFGLSCPYVVTVHDLTTLILPDLHTCVDVAYWRWIEPLTVRAAAQVVAVSQTTASDIGEYYGVTPGSVDVIRWAAHERFVPISDCSLASLRQRYGLPENFLLFLGIMAKKKNLPTLLRALAVLRSRRPDAPDLVVVGRRYPQSEDTESSDLARGLSLDGHVHFVGSVPDEDLPSFYSAAYAYILPSLHEGFGIPCLEAMACGTPVIVCRTGALPEVVGDAALVINDPFDVDGLADAIERLLDDQCLRNQLIDRGLARAQTFSWQSSAEQMLDLYHRVVEA